MIKYTLGGRSACSRCRCVLQVAGSLGPMPQNSLSQTFWNGGPSGPGQVPTFKPLRLMRDPENTPIKAEDVTIGSVFHVMPQGLLPDPVTGDGGTPNLLEETAKAAVLLMRLDEDIIESQKQRDWGYHGIVAYSKICTHVGCPVGLYEQQTHHLLCPCHQSTFDVTAGREGHLRSRQARPCRSCRSPSTTRATSSPPPPFQEAVGPSFWERGR